jgi:non-ribosomal peptide synthetase component F
MHPLHSITQRPVDILESQPNYSHQLLQSDIPLLQLLPDHPRMPATPFRGAALFFAIPSYLSEALRALSQTEETSLFTILLASFKILLARYTGQDIIPVGTPIADAPDNLPHETLLPLCTDLSGNPSFREALRRVREVALGSYGPQALPSGQIMAAIRPGLDADRAPLFQAIFAFQDRLYVPSARSAGGLWSPQIDQGSPGFDLALSMADSSQGLQGELIYNADLFEATTISRMVEHFQTLLESIIGQTERPIGELPLLTDSQRQQLVIAWNDTQAPFPHHLCIHHLFEAQVARTPDAIAAVFGEEYLTYQELNRRANQLAHFLRGLGVGPEELVGLCVDRSLDLVVGLLGILKAGGAYLPLDPAYPQDRLAFMLQDARVSILLTQQNLIDTLSAVIAVAQQDSAAYDPIAICLDTDWHAISESCADNPAGGARPDNLAYVIYTSGSTGRPKGVLIAHQGLCNLAEAQIRAFDIRSDSRVLQFSS